MEKHYYLCPVGHIAKVMVYPVADREICPRLPEHSECDVCHAVLVEIDSPGPEGKPLAPQPLRPHEAK